MPGSGGELGLDDNGATVVSTFDIISGVEVCRICACSFSTCFCSSLELAIEYESESRWVPAFEPLHAELSFDESTDDLGGDSGDSVDVDATASILPSLSCILPLLLRGEDTEFDCDHDRPRSRGIEDIERECEWHVLPSFAPSTGAGGESEFAWVRR